MFPKGNSTKKKSNRGHGIHDSRLILAYRTRQIQWKKKQQKEPKPQHTIISETYALHYFQIILSGDFETQRQKLENINFLHVIQLPNVCISYLAPAEISIFYQATDNSTTPTAISPLHRSCLVPTYLLSLLFMYSWNQVLNSPSWCCARFTTCMAAVRSPQRMQ